MPNHNISPQFKADIEGRAQYWTSLRESYAVRGFPLPHAVIQAAFLPAADVAILCDLHGRGFAPLPRSRHVGVVIGSDFPGVVRPLGLHLAMNDPVFHRDGARVISYHSWDYIEKEGFFLTREMVPEEHIQPLTAWVNHVVRERRLAKMACAVVRDVLSFIDTTYHAAVRWPLLGAILRDNDEHKPWMSDRPRFPQKYGWEASSLSAQGFHHYEKHMQAAETVLVAAMMLPPLDESSSPADAEVTGSFWKQLPGDQY